MTQPGLITAHVDFNAARDAEMFVSYEALKTRQAVEPGLEIGLYDWEGNSCRAIVKELGERGARVQLVADTWIDAEAEPSLEQTQQLANLQLFASLLQETSNLQGWEVSTEASLKEPRSEAPEWFYIEALGTPDQFEEPDTEPASEAPAA